jgi:DNA-binding transcriptional MerR regulator
LAMNFDHGAHREMLSLTILCGRFTFMKTVLFSFSWRIFMETFDSKTASRIVGVSLRQLQYWDEQNFLRPSAKPAEGRGTRRLYSFNDLVCLKVVKDLTRHGFNLQKIRRCVKPLKENASRTEGAAESLKYLTDGEELFVITSDRQKILAAMERRFVLSLGIGNLVREVDREARRAAPGRKPTRKNRPLEGPRAGAA